MLIAGGSIEEQNFKSFEKFVNVKVVGKIPELTILKWKVPVICKTGTLKKTERQCSIAETQTGYLVVWYEGKEDEDFGVTEPITIIKHMPCRKLRMKYKDG